MTNLSFAPTFHHVDWIDNVDRIKAGGPNGFNVRLNAVEADLLQVSTVVGQIDGALDQVGGIGAPPVGQQQLHVPLALVSPTPSTGWNCDINGAFHPAVGAAGGTALMTVALPEHIRLISLRAVGVFPGATVLVRVGLFRVSATGPAGTPDKLAEARTDVTGVANPYDLTVPVDPAFALVDPAAFRYFITATAAPIADATAAANTSLDAVQIDYVAN
jgi:hypothetical protein